MRYVDRLATWIFDPAQRVNPFLELAVVNAVLGILVAIFHVGTPQFIHNELGVPRWWFVLLCFAAALLPLIRRSPAIYMAMVAPIFVYAAGTIFSASRLGIWPTVLLYWFLIYQLMRRYSILQDRDNGLS